MKQENLLYAFSQFARYQPQRIVISVGEYEYCYDQLLKKVQKISGWIASLSLPSESRVGVFTQRDFLGYAAVYACVWAGVTYVPLNPKLPIDRLKKIIKCAQLSAIITEKDNIGVVNDIVGPSCELDFLSIDSGSGQDDFISWSGIDDLKTLEILEKPAVVNPNTGAYLMFTSGTTGEPKGILATVANLQHYLDYMQRRYHITPNDRLSQLFELSFDASTFDLFMSVNHGASFHTVPDNQLLAPGVFIQNKVLTLWFGVPSNIAYMHKMRLLKPNCFPDLRISIFGGEPMPQTSMQAWHAAAPNTVLDNVYGPTEATVTCFMQRCNDSTSVTKERGVMSIGIPYDGMLGAIVDANGKFISVGEKGELLIAGPQLTPGYWQDDDLAQARFCSMEHPIHGTLRWYFTGDLAIEDENGIFHHLGRIDNQIKVSGHRVELEEIDSVLRDVAKTNTVAAVPWLVEHGSARGVVAFICQSEIEISEIRELIQMQLPAYMVPRQIITMDTLPYTLNGKVDRKALVKLLEERM